MKTQAETNGKALMELDRGDADLLARSSALPFTIQNILVPVDFSACSKKALAYALPFARQFGATITLAHVLQISPIAGTEFTEVDFLALEARARKDCQDALQTLAEEQIAQGFSIRTHLASGRAWPEIVELAKQQKTDLIIISTHGHTGLKHVLLGSIAENVVRHAPCPVLVVRKQEREFVTNGMGL
jgi:universal stress protein A